jgi:hypothetical protein
MLIYTTASSPRLRYILDLVIRDIAGIDYELSHDPDEFGFFTGPKLNYSEHKFGDELFLYATPLLFEKKIRKQDPSVFDWNDTKAFFATHPKYILPFDPFAASFYMVSRYEEYLPFTHDKHNRFDASESLAFKKGFLQKPLVNIYARKIRELILAQYPGLPYRESTYSYISTVDIDNAWAYKSKGLIRTCGALMRSALNFDFRAVVDRLAVLSGRKKDPYDTYDLLFDLQQRYGLQSIYFFLLGDYAENDKNVSISRPAFQSLIKSIADYCDTGIHPSYLSNEQPARIRLEQSRLQKIVRKEITKSRQHFLRLSFPSTYRQLINCDITDDYTMGYSGEIGFRAGICSPFYFYDLENESETKLKIHPFMVMDATLKFYMKISPAEVMSYVGPLIKEVKSVKGTFISLWHNESMSDIKPWEEWRDVYEKIIKAAIP